MSYDPELRRDTPLALKIKEQVRQHGPIGVDEYVQICLSDTEHGYYTTQSGIGRLGDFITAPEISQVFGELLGLWAVVVWQQMGRPSQLNLVELGPGRGTLMADALRAASTVPSFMQSISLHLVEINPTFKELQKAATNSFGCPISWHETVSQIPTAPTIVVANEFLDTVPSRQFRSEVGEQLERTVNLSANGGLMFEETSLIERPPLTSTDLPPGSLWEAQNFRFLMEAPFIQNNAADPLAALFVDYGYTDAAAAGDTLQAIRNHRFEHPLTSPGEADLSFDVNFQAIANIYPRSGFTCDGPITQSEFLGNLGISERTSALMAANPNRSAEIEAGTARLMSPTGMGTRFKAIGVRSQHLPPLPGFPATEMTHDT